VLARGYAVRLAEIDENGTVEANGDALAAELERLAGDDASSSSASARPASRCSSRSTGWSGGRGT
jgi:hypothetical protein